MGNLFSENREYKTLQGKRLHEFFKYKSFLEISKIMTADGVKISNVAVRETILGLRDPSPKILRFVAEHGGDIDAILGGDSHAQGAVSPRPHTPEVVPDDGKSGIDLPVCGMAAAASGAFEPVNECAPDDSTVAVRFPLSRPGDCVIQIEGASMEPWYPSGTLVLLRRVDSSSLRNGSRVVAILPTGETVCKVFCATSKRLCLFAINRTDGKNYTLRKGEQTEGLIIYKVIQTLRNEDALDSAMRENGITHFWQEMLAKCLKEDGDREEI